MKHISTWDLLDLADEYDTVAGAFLTTSNPSMGRYLSAMDKLKQIDAELLSRMPEGESVTLVTGPLPIRKRDDGGEWVIVDHWYQPVGFEPYMGEDNVYDSYLSLDDFNRQGFYD